VSWFKVFIRGWWFGCVALDDGFGVGCVAFEAARCYKRAWVQSIARRALVYCVALACCAKAIPWSKAKQVSKQVMDKLKVMKEDSPCILLLPEIPKI
jgi:hypothetical protein